MESISERIAFYRERIETLRAQHHIEKPVELMAVTKFVTPERINEAIEQGGIRLIGENRPQELVRKYDALHLDGVRVHQIGTLQKNKVKYLIGRADRIDSVDRDDLLAEIERLSEKAGVVTRILLEVNAGEEEQPGGYFLSDLSRAAEKAQSLPHVALCGLMAVLPKADDAETLRPLFSAVRKAFDDLKLSLKSDTFTVLSMGMSADYKTAISCGANEIRLGTLLFGERNYK